MIRSVLKAEFLLSNLDESVTANEIVEAVTTRESVQLGDICVGRLRLGRREGL